MLLLLAWASGFVGITSSQAQTPPPPLIPTTVMPGTVDLDKVYKSEKDQKKKAALKDKDRQKYGLEGGQLGKGYVKKKN
jgi:hypothetical protein